MQKITANDMAFAITLSENVRDLISHLSTANDLWEQLNAEDIDKAADLINHLGRAETCLAEVKRQITEFRRMMILEKK